MMWPVTEFIKYTVDETGSVKPVMQAAIKKNLFSGGRENIHYTNLAKQSWDPKQFAHCAWHKKFMWVSKRGITNFFFFKSQLKPTHFNYLEPFFMISVILILVGQVIFGGFHRSKKQKNVILPQFNLCHFRCPGWQNRQTFFYPQTFFFPHIVTI